MTNLEAVISILAAHREARRWSDDAVAVDLLARLGLDAGATVSSDLPPEPETPAVIAPETPAPEHVGDAVPPQ